MKRNRTKSTTTVQNARKRSTNSPAQLWAKQRNWAKLRLTGAAATFHALSVSKHLTPGERHALGRALDKLNVVLRHWDTLKDCSKQIYLEETK